MTIGTQPTKGGGFGLVDQDWLLALAAGSNVAFKHGIVAHAGGTKALAFQLPSDVAIIGIGTVAVDHDSCLLPSAKAGKIAFVYNAGAHIADLYGRGSDQINGAATANAYSLTSKQAAVFFCDLDGHWAAVKSA